MSQAPPQEADILVHENRFLKQTILSLRDELVLKEQEQENLLQSNLTKVANENLLLKVQLGPSRKIRSNDRWTWRWKAKLLHKIEGLGKSQTTR